MKKNTRGIHSGESANAYEAIALLEQHKLDVVLSDIRMPKANASDLALPLRPPLNWPGARQLSHPFCQLDQ